MQQTVFNFFTTKSKNFNLFKQTLGVTICGEISHCVRIWEKKKWGNLLVRTYLGGSEGGAWAVLFLSKAVLLHFFGVSKKYCNVTTIFLIYIYNRLLFFHVHMFIIFLSFFNSKDVLVFFFFFRFWKSGRLVPSRFDEQFYNNRTRTNIRQKRNAQIYSDFLLKFLQCNCTNFFKLFFCLFLFLLLWKNQLG